LRFQTRKKKNYKMKTEGEVDGRIGSKVIYSWIGSSLTGCKLVPGSTHKKTKIRRM
jgi:hypothetical protein